MDPVKTEHEQHGFINNYCEGKMRSLQCQTCDSIYDFDQYRYRTKKE